jgi:hypothetical protein
MMARVTRPALIALLVAVGACDHRPADAADPFLADLQRRVARLAVETDDGVSEVIEEALAR